jgi:hypothetical protein
MDALASEAGVLDRSVFGGTGSLLGRINSLFARLGNSFEQPGHFNGLGTAFRL